MKLRIISGVVIAVLVVVLGLEGGVLLAAALMLCSMAGFHEMTSALGVHDAGTEKYSIFEYIGEAVILLYYGLLIYYYLTQDRGKFASMADTTALVCALVLFFVCMAIYVFTFPKFKANQCIYSVFAFLYVPVLVSCIFKCDLLPYGRFVYILCFLCSWVCDTCAYAVGMMCGKHKMAPILSPKKTIEGAIGGIAGSVIACVITGMIAERMYPGIHVTGLFAVIGLVGSGIGMTGDLAASAIKRENNIKDYGKVIPGHGGIMDRFDSVIFTAPVIYFLAVNFLTEIAGM